MPGLAHAPLPVPRTAGNREAIVQFEKKDASPDAEEAYVAFSRTLLMQRKLDEARKAVRRAGELDGASSDPALKLLTAIQSSRIAMAAAELGAAMRPPIASARQQLLAVIVTAKKQGYYAIECEARRVLDELTMKTNSSQGRSQVVNLADDARRHGFELVARKAVQMQALSGR